MLKSIFFFLASATGIFLAMTFFAWWSMAVVLLITGYTFNLKPLATFILGFLAAASIWAGYSFLIDAQNESLLSGKMASLLKLPSGAYLIALSGLIGGLVGGFAGLSGRLARFSTKLD
jgi:ABC-type transport system involved in cytochrome c biogenesis permease subunit